MVVSGAFLMDQVKRDLLERKCNFDKAGRVGIHGRGYCSNAGNIWGRIMRHEQAEGVIASPAC